jgi:hypothetical protein
MRKLHILAAAAAMTAGSLFADVQIGKGLSVGGYLDMTYTNVSTDTAGVSADTSGFNVATAEIDFSMDFGGGLTAQIDLEGNVGSDGAGGSVEVEQARIDYGMGQGTLTMGKFDTFIGLEGLEAPDLYQYSNSLTFALEPTQHEGLLYSFDNGNFNFAFAIVNGITSDNANSTGDNETMSYAAHVGFTPSDALSFNINYATEEADADMTVANQSVIGGDLLTVDASYTNHGWTVGAEYVSFDRETSTTNGAATAVTNADGNESTAWMLMANYMFNEQMGATVRYSTEETDNAAGVSQTDTDEFTFAVSYAVTPNWSALIEYQTMSEDVAKTDTDTIALETILTF